MYVVYTCYTRKRGLPRPLSVQHQGPVRFISGGVLLYVAHATTLCYTGSRVLGHRKGLDSYPPKEIGRRTHNRGITDQ